MKILSSAKNIISTRMNVLFTLLEIILKPGWKKFNYFKTLLFKKKRKKNSKKIQSILKT